jgi:broad specificity phosphatase PhoE
MPTRVWLLRHAETARPDVFHGAESDVGLSERGRRQAESAAPILAKTVPAAVVSSAMLRARLTAEPIVRASGAPHRVEPDLHERRVGGLSGQPSHGGDGVWPDTLRRWSAGDTGFAPPGAESFDQIRDRALPVWRRLTAEFAGRNFIIVAHGVVCKVLLLSLLPGRSPGDWTSLGPVRNLSVSELVGDGNDWQAARLLEVPAGVG